MILFHSDFTLTLEEKSLIAKIRGLAGRAARPRGLVFGIGDDCAILRIPRGHAGLATSDFSLEGIHFRREWHPPDVVGHRCLVRGLSDIAAMGGEPIAAFLSLALPRKLPQRWVDEFLAGFFKLANRFNVPLAGGDTAQSPGGILAHIVVVGSVPKGQAILRHGARPGHLIYVSGTLGGAAATLDILRRHPQRKLRPADFPTHFYPMPRVALGRVLRQKRLASAMIDVSDGLSTDLAHICEESGVGAEISAAAVPCGVDGDGRDIDLQFALHGGDDYELLFTAAPGKHVPARIAGVAITQIGRMTRGRSRLLDQNGARRKFLPHGWQHFAR